MENDDDADVCHTLLSFPILSFSGRNCSGVLENFLVNPEVSPSASTEPSTPGDGLLLYQSPSHYSSSLPPSFPCCFPSSPVDEEERHDKWPGLGGAGLEEAYGPSFRSSSFLGAIEERDATLEGCSKEMTKKGERTEKNANIIYSWEGDTTSVLSTGVASASINMEHHDQVITNDKLDKTTKGGRENDISSHSSWTYSPIPSSPPSASNKCRLSSPFSHHLDDEPTSMPLWLCLSHYLPAPYPVPYVLEEAEEGVWDGRRRAAGRYRQWWVQMERQRRRDWIRERRRCREQIEPNTQNENDPDDELLLGKGDDVFGVVCERPSVSETATKAPSISTSSCRVADRPGSELSAAQPLFNTLVTTDADGVKTRDESSSHGHGQKKIFSWLGEMTTRPKEIKWDDQVAAWRVEWISACTGKLLYKYFTCERCPMAMGAAYDEACQFVRFERSKQFDRDQGLTEGGSGSGWVPPPLFSHVFSHSTFSSTLPLYPSPVVGSLFASPTPVGSTIVPSPCRVLCLSGVKETGGRIDGVEGGRSCYYSLGHHHSLSHFEGGGTVGLHNSEAVSSTGRNIAVQWSRGGTVHSCRKRKEFFYTNEPSNFDNKRIKWQPESHR